MPVLTTAVLWSDFGLKLMLLFSSSRREILKVARQKRREEIANGIYCM